MNVLYIFNILVFMALSALHFYWAAGGRWGFRVGIPTDSNGHSIFKPGVLATVIVALGLLMFALINLSLVGEWFIQSSKVYLRYMLPVIGMIFALRAIGDFKYIGILKQFRKSTFTWWDSWLYTPLCFVLTLTHLLLYLCD